MIVSNGQDRVHETLVRHAHSSLVYYISYVCWPVPRLSDGNGDQVELAF